MLKLVAILLVITVLFRWGLGFWPWELAKGPDAKGRQIAAARRVLGVSPRADKTEILAAHKLLMTRVHPDRGGSSTQVHEANDARDLLLEELGEKVPVDEAGGSDGPSQD